MVKFKSMRGLVVAGALLASGGLAAHAQASICQGNSTGWEQTFNDACGGRLDAAAGFTDEAKTNRMVFVNKKAGIDTATQGRNSGGSLIAGCIAQDSSANGTGASDIDGCNTGVTFSWAVTF
jgi:hypothetical protein